MLPEGPANENAVAVDPTNSLHVLASAKDYSVSGTQCGAHNVWGATYVTFDGGATWTVSRVPGWPGGPASPLTGYGCDSDPVVAFSPDGAIAYQEGLAYNGPNGDANVYVARSFDGGKTWPASDVSIVQVSSGDDKEWMTVDNNGVVHVAWIDFNCCIRYAHSGATWGTWVGENNVFAYPGGGNPAVELAVGPANELYVSWRDGDLIRLEKSVDGGNTFTGGNAVLTVSAVDSGAVYRTPFMPQIAVDRTHGPASGTVYFAWDDGRQGNANIFFAYARDGAHFSTPIRVNDDTASPVKREHFLPAISVAPNGNVWLSWLDGRLTPTTEEMFEYAAVSTDDGLSFSVNRLVGDTPIVAKESYHQEGYEFIGDYWGLAAGADYAWPAFVITPMQRADLYTAPLANPPNAGAADLVPPATPAPSPETPLVPTFTDTTPVHLR
ncbi:MAG: NHL repeat-containing protein [Thermoplasmatota archaeon]